MFELMCHWHYALLWCEENITKFRFKKMSIFGSVERFNLFAIPNLQEKQLINLFFIFFQMGTSFRKLEISLFEMRMHFWWNVYCIDTMLKKFTWELNFSFYLLLISISNSCQNSEETLDARIFLHNAKNFAKLSFASNECAIPSVIQRTQTNMKSKV